MEEKKTFQQYYASLGVIEREKLAIRLAEVTDRSIHTVHSWGYGYKSRPAGYPSERAQARVARELKMRVEDLFPPRD